MTGIDRREFIEVRNMYENETFIATSQKNFNFWTFILIKAFPEVFLCRCSCIGFAHSSLVTDNEVIFFISKLLKHRENLEKDILE